MILTSDSEKKSLKIIKLLSETVIEEGHTIYRQKEK
jgi:hypothetical protein